MGTNTSLRTNSSKSEDLLSKLQITRSKIKSIDENVLHQIKQELQDDAQVDKVIHPSESNESFESRKQDTIEFLVGNTVGILNVTGAIGSDSDRTITELTLSTDNMDDIIDRVVTDPDGNLEF